MIKEYETGGAETLARVHDVLADQRHRFAGARIRTSLPILIERATRAELAD